MMRSRRRPILLPTEGTAHHDDSAAATKRRPRQRTGVLGSSTCSTTIVAAVASCCVCASIIFFSLQQQQEEEIGVAEERRQPQPPLRQQQRRSLKNASAAAEIPAHQQGLLPPPTANDPNAEAAAALFDCGADPESSLCRYFSPHEFFRSFFSADSFNSISRGRTFAEDEYYDRIGGFNENLPAITTLRLWWRRRRSNATGTASAATGRGNGNLPPQPQTLSFVHVHKCGGSTLIAAMHRAPAAMKDRWLASDAADFHLEANVTTYKYAFGPTGEEGKLANAGKRRRLIQSIADAEAAAEEEEEEASEGSSSSSAASNLCFSVVRDPVNRFLSAVQQVMKYNDDFRGKCSSDHDAGRWWWGLVTTTANVDNVRRTVQCAIDEVSGEGTGRGRRRRPFLGDVHLLPMATHFRIFDEHPSVRHIRVFHLDYGGLPMLTRYLAGTGDLHVRGRSGDVSGSSKGYSSSSLLAKAWSFMKAKTAATKEKFVPDDLTPEMIRSICDLYAVDVAMMRHLGFPTPHCRDGKDGDDLRRVVARITQNA